MSNKNPKLPGTVSRIGATAGLLALFLLLIWTAGRAGFASLLTAYAQKANLIASADAAVKLSPRDPDAHLIRGAILEANNELPAAISEYKIATALRPDDYVLWLSLARASELSGNSAGAIAAATQAVPLAPYYAQPHWQLGNLLIRAGQREEGFKELRLAGASNPTLLPGTIDLAWQLSAGDAQFVLRVIAPQSPESHQALADYFRKRGQVAEAIASYSSAGSEAETTRQQFLAELLAAKRFKDAYSLWLIGGQSGSRGSGDGIGILSAAGFEQEINLDEPGFGWHRANKAESVLLSMDVANPREGRASLSVEFKGDSEPGVPIISQLVLVAPNAHYQVSFAARAESIVSGGLPRVVVMDASDNQVLGSPINLPQQTGGWQDYTIDFNSKGTAILISCTRANCTNSPCPIFGRLWLDNFSLRKL